MRLSVSFEKRPPPSTIRSVLVLLVSILVGLLASGGLFLLKGVSPVTALEKVFMGSFGTWYGFKETVTKAIPLILTGAGLALAFKGKVWNIGAEGQILCGAIAATWFGLWHAEGYPRVVVIVLMFTLGFLGGAFWAGISALLKAWFGVNEAISSLMLNYIAAEVVSYLIYGPWKGPSQGGFPFTDDLPEGTILPTLARSRIHYPTLVLAIFAALFLYKVLSRGKFGFEVRVSGENPQAAAYAGMSSGWTVFLVMAISGGLAGMAGVGELAGIHRHLTVPGTISAGYGFAAIITAFLARLNPALVIFSSLFFGGILVGGDKIQTSLGLPYAAVSIFNGMILLAVIAGDFFLNNRMKIRIVG